MSSTILDNTCLLSFIIIDCIQILLNDEDPDVIAIAEPSFDELNVDWGNYKLIKGSLKNAKKTRLNVLIKGNVQFEHFEWNVDVPMVGLKIDEQKLILVYQEWSKDGDPLTRSMDQQLERWKKFIEKAKGQKEITSIL